MRRLSAGVLALAFSMSLIAAGGCAAPHLQDRLDDASRMFRLNLGCGPGLLANVHVTRCLALGAGAYDARRFGFRNGYGWVWDERRYDANLVVPIWGWEDVDSVVYGGMPKTLLHGDEHHPLPSDEGKLFDCSRMPLTINDKNRGWAEVSANVHLIYIGVDVGVDVGQTVDFVFGWFGIDFLGNDHWSGRDVAKHDPAPIP